MVVNKHTLPLEQGGAGSAVILTPALGPQTIDAVGSSVHPPPDW